MTDQFNIPPMPEVYAEADTESALDAVRVHRLDELRTYARVGWEIVGEMEEALRHIAETDISNARLRALSTLANLNKKRGDL